MTVGRVDVHRLESLSQIANALKETHVKTPDQRRRAVQTFQYFIKEFRDKIDSPELEIRDLAMGIRGYGIFANVSLLSIEDASIDACSIGLQTLRHRRGCEVHVRRAHSTVRTNSHAYDYPVASDGCVRRTLLCLA